MRVKINRNLCLAHLAFCERCLGRFLRYPLGYERRCFELLDDDNSETLTIELYSGDQVRTYTLDEEQRMAMAGEGWTAFVDFDVPIYRNNNARHGLSSQ